MKQGKRRITFQAWRLRAGLIMASLFVLFIIITNSCIQFRKSDKIVKKEFNKLKQKVDIKRVEIGAREIRYIKSGNQNECLIVFLHGAPGSSQDFYHFMQDSILNSKFTMISIDRPGYGYSNFGKSEKSIKIQAEMFNELVSKEALGYDKVILVGHSYGGPIAGIMCAMNSDLYDHVLMLAPANDPDLEKIFWFAYLAKWPPFKWLTPKALRVSADEKFSHSKALTEVKGLWLEIEVNIDHIHGTNDVLVPFENIEFSKRNIPNTYLRIDTLEGVNHFLPWSHKQLITEVLLKYGQQNH
jgi:pimeloyl-ACP methyl ester carboxylesterase